MTDLTLDLLPFWALELTVFLVGLAIGSFISLISYRLPLDLPVGMTRSRCTSCDTVLTTRDLFPVLSWVLKKGACRHCDAKVSVRYLLLELACGLGALALLWWFGPTALTLVYIALWWMAVAMIVTDLEHYLILDELQIAMALLAIVYGYVAGLGWQPMLIGAFTGLAIGLSLKYGFLFATGKDGLGLGDVKFLFVGGLWLASPSAFVPFLFLSGVLGIVSALGWRVLGKGEVFPFGPALMLALLACVYHPYVASGFWRLYGFLQH